MKKRWLSVMLAATMVLSLAACGGNGGDSTETAEVPTIDEINGEDYKDLKADIKILTNSLQIKSQG